MLASSVAYHSKKKIDYKKYNTLLMKLHSRLPNTAFSKTTKHISKSPMQLN